MIISKSLGACLPKMTVRIISSQVYLNGSNLQFPFTRSSSFLRGGSRQFVQFWQSARNLSVNSASSNSLTISESSQKRQRRKTPVKAGSSNATETDGAALQLVEPAENVDARLPPASYDQDLQQGDDRIAEELAAMTGTISICEHVPIAVRSVCVGIDPDLSGAIAVLRTENNTTSGEVIDVPCVIVAVNKKMRRRHDYEAIAKLVRQLQAPEGSIAYVEQAMPFPKDGKQGWYITGYGYGVWLGILAAAGFTIIPVQARVWKTAMGICGKDFTKDDSRALAASLFPALSLQLKRKKDHGRAEALLIAAFGKGMVLTRLPPGGISSQASYALVHFTVANAMLMVHSCYAHVAINTANRIGAILRKINSDAPLDLAGRHRSERGNMRGSMMGKVRLPRPELSTACWEDAGVWLQNDKIICKSLRIPLPVDEEQLPIGDGSNPERICLKCPCEARFQLIPATFQRLQEKAIKIWQSKGPKSEHGSPTNMDKEIQ